MFEHFAPHGSGTYSGASPSRRHAAIKTPVKLKNCRCPTGKNWGRYDQWLAKQFAYFLDRMKTVTDEHGPILDNTLVLYGSACSSTHNARNYPLVLAGGSQLGVEHGSYTVFDEKHTPMSNLFVSMLNAVGMETQQFSDSTGKLPSVLP
jgi:hypothetical protein